MSVTRNLPVSEMRIAADIDALAAITEPGRPWTRRAFTPMHLQGRAYLEQCFQAAGLRTHIDASGNLIGRRPGRRSGLGTIMLGSHSDTVPDGGRFDGIAGVIAALEVARTLLEVGITLDHDLEIVDFLAEEVSLFGVSCIGSRGMAGIRPPEWLQRQADGITLAEGIIATGGDTTDIAARTDIRAFLELHIEQGPVLETQQLDIGVVTAIAGIIRIEIITDGRADHAGTTPMTAREDALCAAARLVLGVEEMATDLASGPRHFAATVGEFEMSPNAANVVPARVRLLIDIRSESNDELDPFVQRLDDLSAGIIAQTGVRITSRRISDAAAVPMDARVCELLEQAVDTFGGSRRRLASGAGHDAAFMARISRAGMVFIPCREGRSHTPEEWTDTENIAFGTAVLLEAVQLLDSEFAASVDAGLTA